MKHRALVIVLAVVMVCATASSASAGSDTVSVPVSTAAVGSTITVSWAVAAPAADDYLQLVRSDGVRVWALYAGTCTPGTPGVPASSGSCAFPIVAGGTQWYSYTAPSPVGVTHFEYHHGNGTLVATSVDVTVTDGSSGPCTLSPVQAGPASMVTAAMGYTAMGDSITSGNRDYVEPPWPIFLQVARTTPYVNAGVGGATTVGMQSDLASVLSNSPQVVFLFGGTNDINYSLTPADQIVCNIDAMVTQIRGAGATPVVIGPIPRDYRPAGNDIVKSALLSEYRSKLSAYASARAIRFVDPWPVLEDAGNPGYMPASLSLDGVHPDAAGALVLAKTIATQLGWSWPV